MQRAGDVLDKEWHFLDFALQHRPHQGFHIHPYLRGSSHGLRYLFGTPVFVDVSQIQTFFHLLKEKYFGGVNILL